jgi:predicted nucleic acid-binding protein
MIADTSFIIDLMMNEREAVDKAKEIERNGSTISVPSPSVFELYVGVALSRKPEVEKTKIIDLIGSLPQIPLDFESARAGGAIYGQRIKGRIQMDPEDAMIAGIAKVRKERLITRNAKHFSGIEGITVEVY